MDVVAEDGCGLWVVVEGAGPPLVSCHGGPGLWDMAEDIARMVADLATVHRWDQRGGGRSERRGPYTVRRFLLDLDVVRARTGAERVALLGHSWGAQLALRYALDHPERVTRLVYVAGTGLGQAWQDPYRMALRERLGRHNARFDALRALPAPTSAEERELAVLRWSTDFADRAAGLAAAERMATPWFPINLEANAAINGEVATWREDALRAACAELHVPTLVLQGEQDPRPVWAVDSLVAALPDVRCTVLPAAGHLPWMDQPAAFRAALRGFLMAR